MAIVTVRDLIRELSDLPAELHDAPVAVYARAAEDGGLLCSPHYYSDAGYVHVQDDEDSRLYYAGDPPAGDDGQPFPVLVTICGQ